MQAGLRFGSIPGAYRRAAAQGRRREPPLIRVGLSPLSDGVPQPG
ncbi:hypothetical protein PUN4_530099 [Paraburkholderia unamae]|nr:hypothetical protein PUN4_530099 [Paraburkholderia unamae]